MVALELESVPRPRDQRSRDGELMESVVASCGKLDTILPRFPNTSI